jgi:transcriptional regulator with XRE-family HTH domain
MQMKNMIAYHKEYYYALSIMTRTQGRDRMLGTRLRQRRRELDVTQMQLAETSGVPQYHISGIERGRIKEIKSDTLRKLARALRISADWLLELEETEHVA